MDKQKLQTILDSHKLWLESDKKEGVRASKTRGFKLR